MARLNDLKLKLTLAGIFAVLSTSSAFAGNADGGGGKGVVCRNTDGSIRTVEVLDLWEARVLHGWSVGPSSGDVKANVEAILPNLAKSFHTEYGSWSYGKLVCKGQDCVLRDLRETAAKFLTDNSEVLRLRGVRLEQTDDARELAHPADCEIEQLINYQPDGAKILVDQELFEKMDTINQAALIAHEAYYRVLRVYANDENSLRTRRAIGFVFSGKQLSGIAFPEQKKGDVLCQSENSKILFSKNFTQIDFGKLSGSAPIGSSARFMPRDQGIKAIMETKLDCKREPNQTAIGAAWKSLGGPVDYDRAVQFNPSCLNGKAVLKLAVRAPGKKDFTTDYLTCKTTK